MIYVLGLKNGHKVTVLTGKPNYPNGNFIKDIIFLKKFEKSME